MKNLICVGTIAGAYGVRGELRVKSFCAVPEDIANYSPLFSEDGKKEYHLDVRAPIKNGFAARIVGIENKEQAEELKSTRLFADRSILPDLPDDEYYYSDLMGLAVYDTGGVQIGTVKTILNNSSDDLLEVQLQGAAETALIPFSKSAVPTVDLTAGRIVIDPPLGLLSEG